MVLPRIRSSGEDGSYDAAAIVGAQYCPTKHSDASCSHTCGYAWYHTAYHACGEGCSVLATLKGVNGYRCNHYKLATRVHEFGFVC